MSWAQEPIGHPVFYVAVGASLVSYSVNGQDMTLTREAAAPVPAPVQYAWAHPTKPLLYVVYSDLFTVPAGKNHGIATYTMDRQSGHLTPLGDPVALSSRPINVTADPAGRHLLVAFNKPSALTVYHLADDGSVGAAVTQAAPVEPGIYAHQVRVSPSGGLVVLCTRGNDATPSAPEDPGALKVFQFDAQGQLGHEVSVTNGNGLGFGPRHLDFHASKPWMYVSMERNNEILLYGVRPDGISPAPLFTTATAVHPEEKAPTQYAGPIHIHPNGRFVYVANRSDGTVEFRGRKVHGAGENTVAVFAIDPASGEPKLIQTIDTGTIHCRTFSIHPNGEMLVTASIAPTDVRDGEAVRTVPAGLTVFSIGDDGKLALVRVYDVDVGNDLMFWCGMVTL